MNKYDGSLRYTVVAYDRMFDRWHFHPRRNDSLVIETQSNRDLRDRGQPTRIVAWCPDRDAAQAARRLLAGECNKP